MWRCAMATGSCVGVEPQPKLLVLTRGAGVAGEAPLPGDVGLDAAAAHSGDASMSAQLTEIGRGAGAS